MKKKRGNLYSFLLNLILSILIIYLVAKYINESKDILLFKDSYLSQIYLDISTRNLLDSLIVSHYLDNKLSNLNGSCVYRYVYDYNANTWVLHINKSVGLEDIKDFLERAYPTNYFYVVKIYNPENLNKVDLLIKMGVIKPENVLIDESSLAPSTFGKNVEGNKNGPFTLVEFQDPIYAKIKLFYYDDPSSSLFYSDDMMVVLEHPERVFSKIQKEIKNNNHYLLIIPSRDIDKISSSEFFRRYNIKCENKHLNTNLTFYKEVFNIQETYKICKPIDHKAEYKPYGKKLTDDNYYLMYYFPRYKVLLLNLYPLNGKMDMYYFLYVYDRFFSRYERQLYVQFFPLTIYGEINKENLNAIGLREYKHYYTKDMLEKTVIEYLKLKD